MIVSLPKTTTSKISKELVKLREQGGAVALGRVLTLVIETSTEGAEIAIEAANSASREHPCRILVLVIDGDSGESALDAEIRVGGDAGASEVIILRPTGKAAGNAASLVTGLLLPDAPVVAWWPNVTPPKISESPIGKIATRRITDSLNQSDPKSFLEHLADGYMAGDSDFAWTRLTLWRAQLAAVLDQPPFESVKAVEVVGDSKNPSVLLLASWLELQLSVPVAIVHREETEGVKGIYRVVLKRETGEIQILRDQNNIATLSQTGQPDKELSLPVRSLRECLAEDLRRLDPDTAFGRVLTKRTKDL
jgi:glucose-6-phosphate dehydrogenase assembly protein OpcA